MRWLLLIYPALTCIYWTPCHAQDFQYNMIVGVSDSKHCRKLPNPEHGIFECKGNGVREECTLKCQEGFIPPITYTPPSGLMNVRQRGTYRCVTVTGGVSWTPNVLFDCVERIVPRHLILYYAMTLPVTCDPKDDMKAQWKEILTKIYADSKLEKAYKKVNEGSFVRLYMACATDHIEADMEIYVPHTDMIADQFPTIRKDLNEAVRKERDSTLKVSGQNKPTIVEDGEFLTDCPRGTRIEGDLTCRGCSKGFYLDPQYAECRQCPRGSYQDENHKDSCKECPAGTWREQDGLRDRMDCIYSENWREHTNVETLLAALGSVVAVVTIVLCYRRTVTYEPGPDTVEKGLLPEPARKGHPLDVEKRTVLESEIGAVDMTNRRVMGAPSDVTGVHHSALLVSMLPVELPIASKAGWRARARERLEMTLEATLLRRADLKRASEQLKQLTLIGPPSEKPAAAAHLIEGEEEEEGEGGETRKEDTPSAAKMWLRGKLGNVVKKTKKRFKKKKGAPVKSNVEGN